MEGGLGVSLSGEGREKDSEDREKAEGSDGEVKGVWRSG